MKKVLVLFIALFATLTVFASLFKGTSGNLVGTEWYSEGDKMVISFADKNTVNVTELLNKRYISEGPAEVRVFIYTYDASENKGKMWYRGREHLRGEWKEKELWYGLENLNFVVQGNRLIILDYKPYNIKPYQAVYFTRR